MKKSIIVIVSILVAVYLIVFFVVRNPVLVIDSKRSDIAINKGYLRDHISFLTSITPSRSFANIESLNIARDYIISEFEKYDCTLEMQTYEVGGEEFSNIICSYGVEFDERVVIGAHYDVHYDNNPGADDNASGVAGILEITRMLDEDRSDLSHRVDIIAYTLEELPHFTSELMGSMVHASKSKEQNQNIKAMISVEMIGYFDDTRGSQNYPFPGMTLLYPSQANYVAVIARTGDRKIVREVKRGLQRGSDIPTYSLNAPRKIPGISFSDHASYWDQDYDAVMVTDTSFMRNANYHTPGDTMETLDFDRMSEVVGGLYYTVLYYK